MGEDGLRNAGRDALARLAGGPVREYFTTEFGRDRDARGLSAIIEHEQVEAFLAALRAELPAGLIAFIGTTHWFGDEKHHGDEVVVAPGEDQYDIIRMGCLHSELPVDRLIVTLKDFETRYGVIIIHAESDTVEFEFRTAPQDTDVVAGELYSLCPDLVEKGSDTLEALEEILRETRRIFLWWG